MKLGSIDYVEKEKLYNLKNIAFQDKENKELLPLIIKNLLLSDPKDKENLRFYMDDLIIHTGKMLEYIKKKEKDIPPHELEEVENVFKHLARDNKLIIDTDLEVFQSKENKTFDFLFDILVEKNFDVELKINLSNVSNEINENTNIQEVQQAFVENISFRLRSYEGLGRMKNYIAEESKKSMKEIESSLKEEIEKIKSNEKMRLEEKKVILDLLTAIENNENLEIKVVIAKTQVLQLMENAMFLMFDPMTAMEKLKDQVKVTSKKI